MPKPLGPCPICGQASVNATTWTDDHGEPDGAAWCEMATCSWSDPIAAHHVAKAQRHRDEEAARDRWHADMIANPDLCPL